MKLSTNFRQL